MLDDITIQPRAESTPITLPPENSSATATADKSSVNLSTIMILLAAGLGISFFLPWITLLFGHPSGFDLQKTLGGVHLMYWSIPCVSALAIIAALMKRSQRTAAQIAGAVPFIILGYWLIKSGSEATNLINSLNYGAFLALACGFGLEVIARWLK